MRNVKMKQKFLKISTDKYTRETEVFNVAKCTKYKDKGLLNTAYLMLQPGLQYNFGGMFDIVLTGGYLWNLKKEPGLIGGLFIRSPKYNWDAGIEMLSYKDQIQYGVSVKWGMNLKKWM